MHVKEVQSSSYICKGYYAVELVCPYGKYLILTAIFQVDLGYPVPECQS